MQKRIPLTTDSSRCSTCMLNNLCLPVGMSTVDIGRFEEVVQERLRITKGESLFKAGDLADAIFGIRVGSLKTQLEDAAGHVQVTGFLLPGEIAGLDGYLEGRQLSHAVALED
ncbi:MAG: cyclic nucleotide-binding domain-containing protein, partial [Pusillimonas sp.]|nr:cyclic nucleotide-binding domain-containing protein [Pusillimonas sp.]